MRAFAYALKECELVDLGFDRDWYTWERGHLTSNNIRERLDKGVAIDSWTHLFLSYSVTHHMHTFSDHCPIVVDTGKKVCYVGRCPFRFEAAWLLEESCKGEVARL